MKKFVPVLVMTLVLMATLAGCSSWEKDIALKYTGIDTTYMGQYTALQYSIENTTNKTLKDVVVIFDCKGTDENGKDKTWTIKYETGQDIEPHNTIDINVMTLQLEKDGLKYSSSDVSKVTWD